MEMEAWVANPQARPKLDIIQSTASSLASMPFFTDVLMMYAKQPVMPPISKVIVYFAMVSPVYLGVGGGQEGLRRGSGGGQEGVRKGSYPHT
jgi:hypothetical protein